MTAFVQSRRRILSNHNGWRTGALAASVACASAIAAPAHAQTKDLQKLEEVIVTAQKYSERLREVPVPVSVVDGSTLVDVGQLTVEDYYTRVPGLNYAVSGEGGQSTIAIRGITTGNDTNPTVGVVIDDISYGATVAAGTGYGVSVADVDPGEVMRVEVLRGPQGTLYGASSMGGLLKYVTIDPSTEGFSGRVQLGSSSVSEGDDLGYAARGSVNVPLSDEFAVRVSAYTLEEPGWVDNVETGQEDFNTRESDGGRLAALWRPSDAFTLKLSALIQDTSRLGSNESDTTLGHEQFNQRFLRGTGDYDRNVEAYSATMIGNVGKVELTSLTGYSVDELHSNTDLTYTLPFLTNLSQLFFGAPRIFSENASKTKKLSQELRAVMPLGDRVKWLVGAYYTDEDNHLVGANQAAVDSGETVGTVFQLTYGPQTFREYSAFTTFTFDITDRLDVQIGGRYSDTRQTSQGIWRGPQSQLVFGADPRILPKEVRKDSATTYLFTPRWKITDDLMVYARLASGYRPGGPNNGCGSDSVPCHYDADSTKNYDVGFKGSVADGALTFDASIYFIDWSDIQISGLFSPSFLFSYTDNVSSAESKGAELALEVRPLDGLLISAWGAYSNAELTADFPPEQIFLLGRSGDKLPYSAEKSGNLAIDWEFPFLAEAGTASLGASVSYVGERTGAFKSSFQPREEYPSYSQLDVSAGLKFDTWSLRLFANNVTDKRAILRGGSDSQFAATYVTYIQPRTIGASLTKTF